MIKMTITIYSGKPGKKKMLKLSDDMADVVEKHFPESEFTIYGGPTPETPAE